MTKTKQILELTARVERLESIVNSITGSTVQKSEDDSPSYKEVIDQWLNGKDKS
ncbi:MAG: hypothetical protein IJ004_06700 [Clostridia bacterium]|nr:hypothetical protein [Clostridia bacterium]MBQ8840990.1 hypothetical protein [Clostridia bacterium]